MAVLSVPSALASSSEEVSEAPENPKKAPLTLDEQIDELYAIYKPRESKTLIKRIIKCEGGSSAHATNTNRNGSHDYGWWQINDDAWGATMAKKGWDIKKPDEGLEAGFWILKNYGTYPWRYSKFCWSV